MCYSQRDLPKHPAEDMLLTLLLKTPDGSSLPLGSSPNALTKQIKPFRTPFQTHLFTLTLPPYELLLDHSAQADPSTWNTPFFQTLCYLSFRFNSSKSVPESAPQFRLYSDICSHFTVPCTFKNKVLEVLTVSISFIFM